MIWPGCEQLKLGKSSAFVKRDICSLPLTEAEFEADFFLDPEFSTKRQEVWRGVVIDREDGSVLAMEDVRLPPPTVNCLANLLAQAMLRPLNAGDRQRPGRIYLRDRPQWQELLPHLRQLGVEVVLAEELPRFDEAVIEWMQGTKKKLGSADEIKAVLRKPFPKRKCTSFTDAMALMEWSDAMFKGAYPSRKAPVPSYDPMTVVPIHLTAAELEAILTKTEIAKTKKRWPRLEAMAAEGKTLDLDINDWSRVVLALCGPRVDEEAIRKHLLKIAAKIANQLAEALGIDPPSLRA
jgi:hypothetical protein